MPPTRSPLAPLLRISAVLLVMCSLAFSQSYSHSRITGTIDDHFRVALKGNVHPLAQARFDQGAVDDSFPVDRMFLLLQRPPAREAALLRFLQEAHHPGTANYHKWLTPAQFGELYGPDDPEISAVSTWLQGHGFSVTRITPGKTAIEFSGTAGQMRAAFHTEIHTYRIQGDRAQGDRGQSEEHHANNVDPQIPNALADVIAGITPMNDFRATPFVKLKGEAVYDRTTHKLVPQWTFPAGLDLLDLGPGDFALQYDLLPLYTAGTTGKGVTIGIIGASNIDPTVVAAYRSFFELSDNPYNVVIDGSDPGQNGAVVESYLDVEESGAVAPDATVTLYTSEGTSVQDGLYLAAQRAVDDNVASVLSTSYGTCEQFLGSSGNQFWNGLWEQAAAQGQTSLVASGDGGPAGCDNFNAVREAQNGIAVSGFASTPWNIAVGGTDFYYSSYGGTSSAQQTEINTYWDTVGTLFPTTSLLKPLPEQPWNDPFGLNLYSGGVYDPNTSTIVGGSGGPSNCSSGVDATDGTYASCSSGYAKPSWQSGTGVTADGVRDVPDVSLFAAAGENDVFYPICAAPGECVVDDGNLSVVVVGGTSASSPAMAGIMALVNQKYGRQGQANYTMYALAMQHPEAFHDVTVGSNVVPCVPGSPNCTLSTANDNTKTYYTLGGYYAGKGYDMATGLGSVDANLLVNNWNALTFKSTQTTLGLSQTTFPHGTPVNVTVGVSGSGGTPSGNVALDTTVNPPAATGVAALTLQAGSAASTVNNLPGGQYQIVARYSGDSSFATSDSMPVSVNISAEASTLVFSGKYYDFTSRTYQPVTNGASMPYGTYIAFDAQPKGVNSPQGGLDGAATGALTFNDVASAGNVTSGALDLNHGGIAEWVPAAGFATGTHAVSASYPGDASFNASTSSPVSFSVTKAAPELSLYVNPPLNFQTTATIPVGTPVTLTFIVGFTAYAGPPTGTATFYYGNTVLGTAPLGPPPYYNPSVAAATLAVSSLPLGIDNVTAKYDGDNNFSGGVSNAVTITVMQSANVIASVNPPSGTLAQDYVANVTVAAAANQPAPTGFVEFFINGGSTWSGGSYLVDGAASFPFDGSTFVPGIVTVYASYSGDSVYAPFTAAVPVNMALPFGMTATPVTVAAGATTNNTSAITITPTGGFTGNAYFQCTLEYYPPGSQLHPTCSVPASVAVTGANPVATVMTISSTGPTMARNSSGMGSGWLAAQLGMAMAAFVLIGIPGRRRGGMRIAILMLVLILLTGLPSCGGGSMSGGGGPKNVPQTTPGTYTFMLEGWFNQDFGYSAPQIVMVQVTIH